MSNGKGSRNRTSDYKAYSNNYERIFGKVKCPICGAKFKWTHICRKLEDNTRITRDWVLNKMKLGEE